MISQNEPKYLHFTCCVIFIENHDPCCKTEYNDILKCSYSYFVLCEFSGSIHVFCDSAVIHFLSQIALNDVVSLCPDSPDEPLYIAKIVEMWEDINGKKMFHGWWFRYCFLYIHVCAAQVATMLGLIAIVIIIVRFMDYSMLYSKLLIIHLIIRNFFICVPHTAC